MGGPPTTPGWRWIPSPRIEVRGQFSKSTHFGPNGEARRVAALRGLGYNRCALNATVGLPPRTSSVRRTRAAIAVLALCLAACASAGSGRRGLAEADRALAAGDAARAETLYRSAAAAPEADPATRAAAQGDLGVALAAQDRWEEAAGALEAARALAPGGPDAAAVLFDLGVAYRHLGRYEEARDAYEHALDLAPGDVAIAYNLGILYELYLNQPGPAVAAYRRYVAAGGPEAARVRRWIEAIEAREARDGNDHQRTQGGNLP